MKLALICLSIFLAVSCSQQRLNKRLTWPISYYSPRTFYPWPYSFDDFPLDSNPSTLVADEAFQLEEDGAKGDQDWLTLDTVQSRSANRFRPKLPSLNQYPLSQQRRFFGAFNPFFSNNNNLFSSFAPQSSTLVTITSSVTLTTAVISTCIPNTQFAAGAANLVCARRRRHVAELMDQLDDIEPSAFFQTQVFPTQVLQVEPTEIPLANIERERRQTDFQGIASSKEDVESLLEDSKDQAVINQRQHRALTVTFSTTSTTYFFTSTVVKKTLNLAASTALSCVPVGYLVC
ncbi:hypothetical protein GHT06_011152 [Daphnia sinensis]|uniref:Uncharacterized protein n=1 Tax=Daphnia sinensis TaxID=1820382 RepID=A0AAD5LTG0_9CRUS|nr:hypothetical protein GHT06_011152 [Daphnia sinensis]